jgi:hypothetical protein
MHFRGGLVREYTLVRRKTNSNFGFCGYGSGEGRLELSKASFADANNRRNALKYP